MKVGRASLVAFAVWAAGSAAMLGGCRGVLGIEDLDVVADGGGTTPGDAKADAPGDSSVAPDAPAENCAISSDCPKCCHTGAATAPGFPAYWGAAKMAGCVCGGAGAPCQTECAADVCVGMTAMPKMGCPECIDKELGKRTPPCLNVKTACGGNAACEAVIACISSCKPL